MKKLAPNFSIFKADYMHSTTLRLITFTVRL